MPDCENDWIHNDVGDVPAVLEGFLTNLCAGAVRYIVKDGKSLWSAIPGFDHTYITLLARCWERLCHYPMHPTNYSQQAHNPPSQPTDSTPHPSCRTHMQQ